jgi:hypothetical protein
VLNTDRVDDDLYHDGNDGHYTMQTVSGSINLQLVSDCLESPLPIKSI